MCEKVNEKNKEVISMEEYLEKRENVRKANIKLEIKNEKKATMVNAALEFAYLYM